MNLVSANCDDSVTGVELSTDRLGPHKCCRVTFEEHEMRWRIGLVVFIGYALSQFWHSG